MAEKKEEKESETTEAAPKKKGKKKLLLILVPVILLVIGGAAAFFLMGSKPEHKEGEEAEEVAETQKHKKLVTLKLDPFIVNLSENISFLKVTMLIEYDPEIIAKGEKGDAAHGEAHGGSGGGGEKKEEGGGTPSQITERQPMIRDAIIRILSAKKVVDVITTEGKEKLKEELIEGINEAIGLPENSVVNVYFIDFIIQ